MKKKPRTRSRGFQRDPSKRYLTKLRFYPYFLYSRLDKWLKEMSRKGWHIVHCGLMHFYFEEGLPQEKEYFTYVSQLDLKGTNSIGLLYPFLEKTYGKKNSKINTNDRKYHTIVEIDLNKIDVKNDVGYLELLSDRKRIFTRFFISMSICIVAALATIIILRWLL